MRRLTYGAAFSAALLLAGGLMLLSGCGPRHIDATGLSSGAQIVQGVCTKCHELDRLCFHLGEDYPEWNDRVGRMISWGAPLTPEQRMAVSAYLALLEPGEPAVCSDGGCIPCETARKKARLGVEAGSGSSAVILGF